MKLINGIFVLALVMRLTSHYAMAQPLSPSRGLMFQPFSSAGSPSHLDSTKGGSEFLSQTGAWGSVIHGFQSANDNFGWGIDIGIAFELWRIENEKSIIAISDMELTARTNNDISFNPKGVFWEEGLLYTTHGTSGDLQFGYLHRCRHDVDNGDTTEFRGVPSERTLIYGSITARYLFRPLYFGDTNHAEQGGAGQVRAGIENPIFDSHSLTLFPYLSTDLYVFREDYRQPGSSYGSSPDFSTLLFSLGAGGLLNLFAVGPGCAYLRGGATLSAFGLHGGYVHSFSQISTVIADGNIELGYSTQGTAARFQIYLGWEHLGDDASTAPPTTSQFLLLGIRLCGTELVE